MVAFLVQTDVFRLWYISTLEESVDMIYVDVGGTALAILSAVLTGILFTLCVIAYQFIRLADYFYLSEEANVSLNKEVR